jgi:predicted ABC-type transport system involved in lysophospholipase L1 biosynthesis ATPase subunit
MPALRVIGLSRAIRHRDDELRVVHGCDLVVPPGSAVGLTGPLDSGWRSLLRLIVGLDPATSGSVELVDRPDAAAPAAARDAAETRQDVVLASALDPLLDGDLARVARAIPMLAASRRRRVRPATPRALCDAAGVDPSRKPAGRSRAERVRLCLALAAWLGPSHVLVEVEPVIGRAEERRAIVEMMRRIVGTGVGMVIGTRDEILLAAMTKTVSIFEDGRVLAEGDPGSILPAAWEEARREGLLP